MLNSSRDKKEGTHRNKDGEGEQGRVAKNKWDGKENGEQAEKKKKTAGGRMEKLSNYTNEQVTREHVRRGADMNITLLYVRRDQTRGVAGSSTPRSQSNMRVGDSV